ncbi:LytR/AlgR family response regulator transcription factor [Nesterenkonia jeotgali]|uniref:DNA-binding LytR/AlgR family response regulator n=1 Tax=Nesterenkonia jeotgali TaxID=317018 RepID=A0A0W8IIR4_9MICC|nr:LytTR family DNA-binding domain-containing protein [Nesterenkonia jeotgali]KUG59802.1 LytTR family transcriptional regulator [Nesterenkonia jeotgali]MBA8921859.1 DNA-binding LytR/AlgR family response regulator [Nesterenkonia jeotgali]
MHPRALIVDDEAPAREELRFLLEEIGGVQVVGEATNGEEALLLLNSLAYDLVFLDIRMPGLTGLQVAQQLHAAEAPAGSRRPQVIFTTAYPDHAVEAFDLSAADYLVKPFSAERLQRSVQRALAGAEGAASPSAAATAAPAAPGPATPAPQGIQQLVRIPVQRDGRTVLVDGDAIVYAVAARGYASLKLTEDRVLVSFSLNELERRLQGHFFRVHRSYLVNLRYVRELVPDFRGALVLVLNDRQRSRVEVSRRHAPELRRRLGV